MGYDCLRQELPVNCKKSLQYHPRIWHICKHLETALVGSREFLKAKKLRTADRRSRLCVGIVRRSLRRLNHQMLKRKKSAVLQSTIITEVQIALTDVNNKYN